MKTIVLVLIGLLAILPSAARAQDVPYVCRDPLYETPRFEFRNLPVDLFVYDNDDGYWYVADGATQDGTTIIADALSQDRDGYLAGTATLGTDKQAFLLVGDASSPLCDATPAPTPISAKNAQVETTCPAVATNRTTGQPYCYQPLAGGVIPIPAAS